MRETRNYPINQSNQIQIRWRIFEKMHEYDRNYHNNRYKKNENSEKNIVKQRYYKKKNDDQLHEDRKHLLYINEMC